MKIEAVFPVTWQVNSKKNLVDMSYSVVRAGRSLLLNLQRPMAAAKHGKTSLKKSATTPRLVHTSAARRSDSDKVSVTFVTDDGSKLRATGKAGQNLLDLVVDNELDLDGFGACEGTLACSTCHVILKQEDFDRLPEEATDEELDMLDLAYGLTDTSRLGCQVCVTKDFDGLQVKVPAGVNDQR